MSIRLMELRAQVLIEILEQRLEDPGVEFPAETLNALLRLLDYPLPYVMDFVPGNYPREVGERIVRFARERLRYVVSTALRRCAYTESKPDDELRSLVEAIEMGIQYMEQVKKRSSVAQLRRDAFGEPVLS